MPEAMLEKLHKHCREQIASLLKNGPTSTTKLLKILAVLFIAITGCRPKEAAWVVIHGKTKPNMVQYTRCNYSHEIRMPIAEASTKTNVDYRWLIDERFGYFIDALKQLPKKPTLSHE